MHCIALAELASVLADSAPTLMLVSDDVSAEALSSYWIHSRTRLERWHHALTEHKSLEKAGRTLAVQAWWDDHEPMIEEVIVSDLLTRIFGAVAVGLDTVKQQRELEPITQSIHVSHLEARNRVLQLLLFGRGGNVDLSMRLNRLRRATERWSDRLLASIVALYPDAIRYAFDGERTMAYVREHWDSLTPDDDALLWLRRSAMTATLRARSSGRSSMPDCNRAIASAVIACLSQECFDSIGQVKSLRLARVAAKKITDLKPRDNQPLFPLAIPGETRASAKLSTARWLL